MSFVRDQVDNLGVWCDRCLQCFLNWPIPTGSQGNRTTRPGSSMPLPSTPQPGRRTPADCGKAQLIFADCLCCKLRATRGNHAAINQRIGIVKGIAKLIVFILVTLTITGCEDGTKTAQKDEATNVAEGNNRVLTFTEEELQPRTRMLFREEGSATPQAKYRIRAGERGWATTEKPKRLWGGGIRFKDIMGREVTMQGDYEILEVR